MVDALSRQCEKSSSLFLNSFPTVCWLVELKQSYSSDTQLQELLKKVIEGQAPSFKFTVKGDLFFYKGRLYLPNDPIFIQKILQLLHSSAKGGHSGVDKTLYRVRRNFFVGLGSRLLLNNL